MPCLGIVRDTSVPELRVLSSTQYIWFAIARIELDGFKCLRPLAALDSGCSVGLGGWD